MENKSEKYWNNFWQNQKNLIYNHHINSWYDFVLRSNHETILDNIKKKFLNSSSLNVIEVGCGSAKFTQFMINKKKYNYTISDRNISVLHQSKKLIKDILKKEVAIKELNLSVPNFIKQEYDIVYSGGVLEFFKNINNPISNMYNLTKENGVCIAVVIPKKFSLQTIANLQKSIAYFFRNLITKRKFLNNFFYSHLDKNTYINSYSHKYYKKAFIKQGFKDVEVYSLVPFPSFALGKKMDKKYAKFLHTYLYDFVKKFNNSNNFLSMLIGSSYLIYAKKN